MKKEKKKFFSSKKFWRWFGVGLIVSFLLLAIFWNPIKEKYTLIKEWQSFRNYQEYIGEEPYRWGEYMEYLERKEDWRAEEERKLAALIQSYRDDAANSLGGDTPEEAYEMFKQALRDNDLEKALLLNFKDDREEVKEVLQPYYDQGKLPNLIEDWDLDDITCNMNNVRSCAGDLGDLICHGLLICAASDVEFEGELYEHDIEFVKNVLDKWQLESY